MVLGQHKNSPPVVGFLARTGTGKTTLLKKLLALFSQQGLRVGVVKHAQRHFDIDQPGKDSFELRQAGAKQMLIGSEDHWALMVEAEPDQTLTLQDHIGHLCHENLDLVLVEGFAIDGVKKIELIRPKLGNQPFFLHDNEVVAIATDGALDLSTELPLLDLNNPEIIAAFITEHLLN